MGVSCTPPVCSPAASQRTLLPIGWHKPRLYPAGMPPSPPRPASVPDPSLADLRVFATAARHGSLSGAARELGITQQAVSARVRAMERLTGVQLFSRSPMGIELTEAGTAALPWAAEVLDATDRLRDGLATLGGLDRARSLAVGASQTIAAHLLPGWLVTLRRQQEEAGAAPTTVQLRTANSAEVIGLVRSGAIGLGLIETPDIPADLGCSTVGSDPLVIAVAAGHPWSARDGVTLTEVARTPLVMREKGSGTRAALERAVARVPGLTLAQPAATLATEAAVRSAIASGIAPAVVSALSVNDDRRLGRIVTVPFSGEAPTRPLTAVWRGAARDLLGARRQLVSIAGSRAGRR